MNYCVKANRYHPPPPLPLLPLLFPLLFSFTNSLGTDAPYTSFLRSLISSECSGWPIISVKYSLHHIYFYASQNMLTWITDNILNHLNSDQSLSLGQLFVTPWTARHQASLSITNSCNLLKLVSIKSVMPSNHLIFCHPFSSCLESFPTSAFSNESALCSRWPKYWSFTFSISPFNKYSALISFRTDWFDLLSVQGALKSLI